MAAAVDDGHVCGHRRLAAEGQVLDRLHGADGLCLVLELEAALQLGALDGSHLGVDLGLAQVIDERRRLAGRHEDVDVGIAGQQLRAGLDADHAAHERHGAVGFALLPRLEAAQFADGLVLGALAHHAGVEHDDVGLVEAVGRPVADLLQLGGDVVGIGHIHLAADGPDVVLACGVGCLVGGQFVGDGLVRVARRAGPAGGCGHVAPPVIRREPGRDWVIDQKRGAADCAPVQ